MVFPAQHRTKLHSTNPIERLNKEVNPLERVNKEIKRRSGVVGSFPNDAAIIRLLGALTIETNDKWAVACC